MVSLLQDPHNGQCGALVGVSHGRASIRLWFIFHLITHTYVCIVDKNLLCFRGSPGFWPWARPYGSHPLGINARE